MMNTNFAIRVETRDELNAVMRKMEHEGCRWAAGEKPMEYTDYVCVPTWILLSFKTIRCGEPYLNDGRQRLSTSQYLLGEYEHLDIRCVAVFVSDNSDLNKVLWRAGKDGLKWSGSKSDASVPPDGLSTPCWIYLMDFIRYDKPSKTLMDIASMGYTSMDVQEYLLEGSVVQKQKDD